MRGGKNPLHIAGDGQVPDPLRSVVQPQPGNLDWIVKRHELP